MKKILLITFLLVGATSAQAEWDSRLVFASVDSSEVGTTSLITLEEEAIKKAIEECKATNHNHSIDIVDSDSSFDDVKYFGSAKVFCKFSTVHYN